MTGYDDTAAMHAVDVCPAASFGDAAAMVDAAAAVLAVMAR